VDVECRRITAYGQGRNAWKIQAAGPRAGKPLIESYTTRDAVDARKAAFERAGYIVIIRKAETLREVLAQRPQQSRLTGLGRPPASSSSRLAVLVEMPASATVGASLGLFATR
jgi:hypothetical protein